MAYAAFVLSRNVTCLPCAGNAVAPFSAQNFIDISLTCSNVILNSNLFQNNLHLIPHSTNLLKISPLAAFQKSHMNCTLFRFCESTEDSNYPHSQLGPFIPFHFPKPLSYNVRVTKTRSGGWAWPFTFPSAAEMTLALANEKIYIKLITSFSSEVRDNLTPFFWT